MSQCTGSEAVRESRALSDSARDPTLRELGGVLQGRVHIPEGLSRLAFAERGCSVADRVSAVARIAASGLTGGVPWRKER